MPNAAPARPPGTTGGPREHFVTCASPAGLHRMAYCEWGDPANDRVLLCVHGLTRTGRDFDLLAQALCDHYRVVCPDIVGRGRSDWLIDASFYGVPQYVADMVTLIAHLAPARLDWLGTSLGGLIGLALAGMAFLSPPLRPVRGADGLGDAPDLPLGRLVLNDVGPALDPQGLARIATYVGEEVRHDDFDAAVAYVRSVSPGYGELDDRVWQDLTRFVFRLQDGQWVKHYDLRLAQALAVQDAASLKAAEALLWRAWESLSLPILVLRGAESDLLSADTLAQMRARNPHARSVAFSGVGHAPALRSPDQIAAVSDFLLAAGPGGSGEGN